MELNGAVSTVWLWSTALATVAPVTQTALLTVKKRLFRYIRSYMALEEREENLMFLFKFSRSIPFWEFLSVSWRGGLTDTGSRCLISIRCMLWADLGARHITRVCHLNQSPPRLSRVTVCCMSQGDLPLNPPRAFSCIWGLASSEKCVCWRTNVHKRLCE